MATRKTKKLSDLQTITSADGNKMIPVVDSNGNVNPIKLSDLATVLAGIIPIVSNQNNGLVSSKKYIYTTIQNNSSGNIGSESTLSFTIVPNNSLTLRLACSRGDGQCAVIFVIICRDSSGKFTAYRQAFVPNSYSNFKSVAFIYYKGDTLYLSFGHFDNASWQVLVAGSGVTYNGTLNSPSKDGFTQLKQTDMITNPSIEGSV